MKKALLPAFAILCALAAAAFAQEPVAPVHVQFIDSATNMVFTTSNMPPDKLPEGFAVNAVLNIGGQKWSVVSANPAAKADFLKTGSLILVLTRVPDAAPAAANKGMMFDVPSVSGDIAEANAPAPPGDMLFLRKNDWRQIEFVSTVFEKEIATEFASIHAIRLAGVGGPGGGFPELNVRQEIPLPVKDCIPRDIESLLPQIKHFAALGFQKQHGAVPHSFAWAVDRGLMLWGLTDDEGNVTTLCLAGTPEKQDVPAISEALARLTVKYDLYLVDWCREVKLHGDAQEFEKYFGGN